MDPILITSAILSQFQTSTLIGTLVGGIIGNRADALLCKSTNKLYEQLKSNVGKPENHDIQRAVRRSYLKATLMAVEQTRSKYKGYFHITSGNLADLTETKKYIQNELKLLSQADIRFPETDFDTEYQSLILPTGKSASDRLPEMIDGLKKSILQELKHKRYRVESTLEEAIHYGWKENGKEIDWYELTCAFFTEELKTNPRISTFIQAEYLDVISNDVDQLTISIDLIQSNLNHFYEEYKNLLQKVEEILSVVASMDDKLDKLPETMRKLVSEELQKRSTVTEFPDFSVPGRHQNLLSQIDQLANEEREVREEIDDLKAELKEANENSIDRKQRILRRAETSLIEVAQQRQEVENELQDFIGNVIKLAEQFSQQKGLSSTPRLEKARALFNEGKYEEVDAVLNEKDIYDEIHMHQEKAKELAEELMVKAQTTLINKSTGWFELTNKYYSDAAQIHESYDTCFAYAYFLAEQRQIEEAVHCFGKSLRYVDDEYQKSVILNNLGLLQSDKNEFEQAETSYNEALEIRRKLAEVNPQAYLSDVGLTLNNLGLLQSDKNEFDKAEASYNEALEIRRKLAEVNPQTYLSYVAGTLNNLGNLQRAKNEFDKAEASYNEALEVYRKLAEVNPQTYLSDVAMTLNNLGNLQRAKNEFDKAEANYNEALKVYRKLAEVNAQRFLLKYATTAVNLASLYRYCIVNKEKSLHYSHEAIKRFIPFVKTVPYAAKWKKVAEEIVVYWNNN